MSLAAGQCAVRKTGHQAYYDTYPDVTWNRKCSANRLKVMNRSKGGCLVTRKIVKELNVSQGSDTVLNDLSCVCLVYMCRMTFAKPDMTL